MTDARPISAAEPTHDVVIVGGGHNGLTAAAYLARAGKSVIVLERLENVGGAAVSSQAFSSVDAWLSRFSYLVSLLPKKIVDDLGLRLELGRRRFSSYSPLPGDPAGRGLLIDNQDALATAASFARVGAASDASAFAGIYRDTGRLAQALWPAMTEPLLTRSEARRLVDDDELWEALIERPIGEFIESRLRDDLVRGIAMTDAIIGTFAGAHDDTLAQNMCFLYHVIGGGTGDWDVPRGGMGSVSGELARVARDAGARIVTKADVVQVSPDGEVRYRRGSLERTVSGNVVLAAVAPHVLHGLLAGDEASSATSTSSAAGTSSTAGTSSLVTESNASAAGGTAGTTRTADERKPEGAQVKVNLLVRRLPRLRDTEVDPREAFAGTMHINETYSQLENAYRGALRGIMPGLIPCEVYCHTLTDPSILDPELSAAGAHTLTVFGLHTPDRWLSEENNDATRARLQDAVLASLNSVLAEPVQDVLFTDGNGNPCIETKTTLDLEHELRMPGGNIFHGPLVWPFVEDDADLSTPAERWGVGTPHPRILIAGAGARRGGGVSGLGGHNAAMAVLES